MTQFRSFARAHGDADPLPDTGRAPRPPAAGAARKAGPGAGRDFSLSLRPHSGERPLETFRRLERALKDADATLLKLMIFGPVTAAAPATEALRRVFGDIHWPVTWVEGLACDAAPLAGVQAFAFSGGPVDRIVSGGRVVGSVYKEGDARFCLLGGLGPDESAGTRAEQTRRTFDQMQHVLAQGGFSLGDVVRTWFFLDDLLSWYASFNEARARAFANTAFRSGCLPASTGVAARNPAGAALTAGAWAMRPLKSSSRACEVLSPLQCPACAYGSLFSRAIELTSGARRRLLISGTASIQSDGQTAHAGNVRAQIELSMRVVEAILESRRLSFADVTRATAYFKSPTDAPALTAWCDRRELRRLPVIATGCGICRPDLLFEIELDAARADTVQ
jgi:enamine deaminase RidA (YjgF/YER057c/UK114 family)